MAAERHKFGGLFECLKLFEVEENSPTAGGERPARGCGKAAVMWLQGGRDGGREREREQVGREGEER